MASGTLCKVRILRSICNGSLWGQGRKVPFCHHLRGNSAKQTSYTSHQVRKKTQDSNPSLPAANLGAYPYTRHSNPMSLQAEDLHHSFPHPGLCLHTQPIAPCSNPVELSTSWEDGMALFLGGRDTRFPISGREYGSVVSSLPPI